MIKDQLHIVHARAGGLDIHKMQITAAVRICQFEAAEPSCETRTFGALPSGVEQLVRWLLEHRVEAAAMEATGVYWQRPFDALYDAGIEVQLYQSQQIRQLKGRKTDVEDARWLARVCQFGLGRPSYVLCKEFRDLRQMSRCRRNWVGDRSRVRNRVHQVLDRSGLRLGGIITDVFGFNAQRLLRGVLAQQSTAEILRSLSHHVRSKHELFADALDSQLSESTRTVLRALLDQHDALSAQIERTDCHLHQALQPRQEQLDLLRTIPGINHNAAVALFIEIGPNLNAFANVHSFAAWTGIAPGNNESAGKRCRGRIRHGNSPIATTLVECAHAAARTKGSQYLKYHRALLVRRGYRRAIVATAHKLARTIYAVLRDQKPYRDPVLDYEELVVRRNAPRWLRELKKFNIPRLTPQGHYSFHWEN